MFDKNFKKPERQRADTPANPLQKANLTGQQAPLSPDTPFRERLEARGHVRPVTTLAIQSGAEVSPASAGNDNARPTVSPRRRTVPRRASASEVHQRPVDHGFVTAAPVTSTSGVQADMPPAEALVPKIPASAEPVHSEPPLLRPPSAPEPRTQTVAQKSSSRKKRRPLIYGPPAGIAPQAASSKLQVFAAAGIAAVGAAGLSVLAANYLLAGSAPTGPTMANAGGAGAPPTMPVTAATDTSAAALMAAVVATEEIATGDDVAEAASDNTSESVSIPDLSDVLSGLSDDVDAAADVERLPALEANDEPGDLPEAPIEEAYDMLVMDESSEDLPMGGPDTSLDPDIDTIIANTESGTSADLIETTIAAPAAGSSRRADMAVSETDISKTADVIASRPSLKPDAPRRHASVALPNETARPGRASAKPARRSLPSNQYQMDAAKVKHLSGAIVDSPRTADEFMAHRVLRSADGEIDADTMDVFREDFLKMIAAAEDGAIVGGHTPDGRTLKITLENTRVATQSLPTVRAIDYGTNGYSEVLRFYSEAAPVKVDIMCRDIAYAIPGQESGRFAACKTTQGEWTLARASDQAARQAYT